MKLCMSICATAEGSADFNAETCSRLQQCVLYFILSSVVMFSGWAVFQERDIYAPMHQVLHLNICLLVG